MTLSTLFEELTELAGYLDSLNDDELARIDNLQEAIEKYRENMDETQQYTPIRERMIFIDGTLYGYLKNASGKVRTVEVSATPEEAIYTYDKVFMFNGEPYRWRKRESEMFSCTNCAMKNKKICFAFNKTCDCSKATGLYPEKVKLYGE